MFRASARGATSKSIPPKTAGMVSGVYVLCVRVYMHVCACVCIADTRAMMSVDLLMNLLLRNHLDAETRVFNQEISTFQYLTGIDPVEPPLPDPMQLLEQPEVLTLLGYKSIYIYIHIYVYVYVYVYVYAYI